MLADPASTESGIQETETVPDLNGTKKESDKFFSNSFVLQKEQLSKKWKCDLDALFRLL